MFINEEYYDSEEFKDLLHSYEQSKHQGSTYYLDADGFLDVSDYYMSRDMTEEAKECLETGLNFFPGDRSLLSLYSGLYIYLHEYEKAREIIDDFDDSVNDIYYQKAQLVYALDKNVDLAEEMFREWIERENENCKCMKENERNEYMRDSYIHVIVSFIQLSGMPDINNDFGQSLIRLYPNMTNPFLPVNTADPELCKRWIEDYIATFSPLGEYKSDDELINICSEQGYTDMFEKVYSLILETDPYREHGWSDLSKAQFMNGKYEDCIESVEYALAINPDDRDALVVKGLLYSNQDMHEECLPIFEKLMSQTNDISVLLTYVSELIECGKKERAMEILNDVESSVLDSNASPEYQAVVNYEFAQLWFKLSDYTKSRLHLDSCLDVIPYSLEFNILNSMLEYKANADDVNYGRLIDCVNADADPVLTVYDILNKLIYEGYYKLALNFINKVDLSDFEDERKVFIVGYKTVLYLYLNDNDNFLKYLKKAVNDCPEFIKRGLSDSMPDGMEPKDYVDYLTGN